MLRTALSAPVRKAIQESTRYMRTGAAALAAPPAPAKTVKLSVDGKEVEVDASFTVLQVGAEFTLGSCRTVILVFAYLGVRCGWR